MGVAPANFTVNLVDEAANLQIGLPQFTDGQLASFNSIVVSDSKPLQLDVDTFKGLIVQAKLRRGQAIKALGFPVLSILLLRMYLS